MKNEKQILPLEVFCTIFFQNYNLTAIEFSRAKQFPLFYPKVTSSEPESMMNVYIKAIIANSIPYHLSLVPWDQITITT